MAEKDRRKSGRSPATDHPWPVSFPTVARIVFIDLANGLDYLGTRRSLALQRADDV